MLKLLVDFNEVHGDRVYGLQDYAEGERDLGLGDRVLLHDDGEEEAWGTVCAIDGNLIETDVDWPTFGPAGRFRHEISGAWWTMAGAMTLMQGGNPAKVASQSTDDLLHDDQEHSAAAPV